MNEFCNQLLDINSQIKSKYFAPTMHKIKYKSEKGEEKNFISREIYFMTHFWHSTFAVRRCILVAVSNRLDNKLALCGYNLCVSSEIFAIQVILG